MTCTAQLQQVFHFIPPDMTPPPPTPPLPLPQYVSRGLSFQSAEFSMEQTELTPDLIALYDGAAAFFDRLQLALAAAIEATKRGGDGGSGGDAWKAFWAMQLRFFRAMSVSIKASEGGREWLALAWLDCA